MASSSESPEDIKAEIRWKHTFMTLAFLSAALVFASASRRGWFSNPAPLTEAEVEAARARLMDKLNAEAGTPLPGIDSGLSRVLGARDVRVAKPLDEPSPRGTWPQPKAQPIAEAAVDGGALRWTEKYEDTASNELWRIEDLTGGQWRIHLGPECMTLYPAAEQRDRSFLVLCGDARPGSTPRVP